MAEAQYATKHGLQTRNFMSEVLNIFEKEFPIIRKLVPAQTTGARPVSLLGHCDSSGKFIRGPVLEELRSRKPEDLKGSESGLKAIRILEEEKERQEDNLKGVDQATAPTPQDTAKNLMEQDAWSTTVGIHETIKILISELKELFGNPSGDIDIGSQHVNARQTCWNRGPGTAGCNEQQFCKALSAALPARFNYGALNVHRKGFVTNPAAFVRDGTYNGGYNGLFGHFTNDIFIPGPLMPAIGDADLEAFTDVLINLLALDVPIRRRINNEYRVGYEQAQLSLLEENIPAATLRRLQGRLDNYERHNPAHVEIVRVFVAFIGEWRERMIRN